jgi:hypothetical protein
MADFFKLPESTQREILAGAESQLGINPFIIEKDLWICLVLQQLFTLNINMAFKGGTSLSKAYHLIDRFSEDVDITIDYHEFSPTTDLDETYSKTALKKLSDNLKIRLNEHVHDVIKPYLKEALQPYRIIRIDTKNNGEKMYIHYPTLFKSPFAYMQNHVLIEFGARNSTDPKEVSLVTPILLNAVKDLELPVAKVKALSPIRTFWEKAALIHVECNRGRLVQHPDRLSRHWYDLYALHSSWVGKEALATISLLEDVILHKKAFFNASYARYDECLRGQFKLIPDSHEIVTLKDDYSNMINSGMFQSTPRQFDKIIESLAKLQDEINTVAKSKL